MLFLIFLCSSHFLSFMLSGTHFQPGFIHSESFRQGYIQLPHYQIQNWTSDVLFSWSIISTWPCWPHSPWKPLYLVLCLPHCLPSRSPLPILFISWLCMLEGPKAPVTRKAFNTIHEVVVLSQTSFPWLSLVWLVSLPLPSKTTHSPQSPLNASNWLKLNLL